MRRAVAVLSILLIVAGVLWGGVRAWREAPRPGSLPPGVRLDDSRASLVFSPDGRRLAYLRGDQLCVHDLATGALPPVATSSRFGLPARTRESFRFLASGEIAVVRDSRLDVLDPRTGAVRQRVPLGFSGARLLDIAPDDRVALVGDQRTMASVDLVRGVLRARWKTPVLEGAVLLDKGTVAAGVGPRDGLSAWRAADGAPVPTMPPASRERIVAWSVAPDRTRLAIAHADGVVRFRRWPDGRTVAPDLTLGLRSVGWLEYYPARDLIAARGMIRLGRRRAAFATVVVDLADRRRVRRFVEPWETFQAAAPSGRLAYLVFERIGSRPHLMVEELRTDRVWRVEADARLRTRLGFDPAPARAAFSPEGTAFAVASGGRGVLVSVPR